MRKLIRVIIDNLRWVGERVGNNRGLAPWILPAAIQVGSTLLGSLGKKKKSSAEEPQYFVDPYIEQQRNKFMQRADPSYYKFTQPAIESATETKLLGRINLDPEKYAKKIGPELAKPYYDAHKALMAERFGEEEKYAKDIFQREGVLTSTPGVQGQIDLKRKQGLELEDFSQRIMYEDIARELEATKLAEDIISEGISGGTMLGNTQREYQKLPYILSDDMLRASSGLTSTPITPTKETSLFSELGKMGIDIGSMLQLGNIINPQKNTAADTILKTLRQYPNATYDIYTGKKI